MALMGGALSAALTPAFSEMIARNDWDECRRLMSVWAGCPGCRDRGRDGADCGCARDGAHDASAWRLRLGGTSAVAQVLEMDAVQIPFFVSSRVFYRFLAARRTDLALYCGMLWMSCSTLC